MNEKERIIEYFESETEGFHITKIELIETKYSYLFCTNCYHISTDEHIPFYVFYSDTLPLNLYPIKDGESLNECYYKHIGLMTELCSRSVSRNFILEFINNNSIFPIIERKMINIQKEITPAKNVPQLNGIANQIRDCYLDLTDYLINKYRTHNQDYKKDNFKDNFQEFLLMIIPGKQSEIRRNTFNGIAQKGWTFNSELVHKGSVTLFDICTSFNILQLVVSITSNLIVGDHMPFNKIKCPNCQSERFSLRPSNSKEFIYVCKDCKTKYTTQMEEILRDSSDTNNV